MQNKKLSEEDKRLSVKEAIANKLSKSVKELI